jgi:hypothetical protein
MQEISMSVLKQNSIQTKEIHNSIKLSGYADKTITSSIE